MKRSWLVTALGAALGVSCGNPTTTPATQLNLDRPVDIAFACYGGMRITNGRTTADPADPIVATAQPSASCESRSPLLSINGQVPPQGQEDLNGVSVGVPSWYGFILESAPGTVAIAQWLAKPEDTFVSGDASVIDADPLTPGKNAISVGEEPIAIATDSSGCYEVTANAGSCDLSVLDINSALDDLPGNAIPGRDATPVRVDRLAVTNKMGAPILARPAAMVAEPNTTIVGNACPTVPAGADPATHPALAPSGVVYIAYPSCHLVAAVDMSDGKAGRVVAGIKYDTAGNNPILLAGTALDNLTCPDDCTHATAAPPDQATARPVALALTLDRRVNTNRLVIGSDNLASVTLVELDPVTSLPLMTQVPAQIALEDKTGKLGISAIALSPQIGMGGTAGANSDDSSTADDSAQGGQGQFVYAVATDNTVRVVDVFVDTSHPTPRECDTQVDTRFARKSSVSQLQCFSVGDPATPARRSGAKGPGIELIGDGVPTSVAFVKATPVLAKNDAGELVETRIPGPSTLLGTFAIITASNGQTFVVNVDDDDNPTGTDKFNPTKPQLTAPTLIMAHQLRDGVTGRGLSSTVPDPNGGTNPDGSPKTITLCNAFGPSTTAAGGDPRATTLPAINVGPGSEVSVAKAQELPSIRQVACISQGAMGDPAAGATVPVSELQFSADLSVRDQVFPDLRSLFSDETWSLTWEGPLSQDIGPTAVDGPVVRTAQMIVDSAATSRIVDTTRPFCEMGVEPFDILQLRGCNPSNNNFDCPAGYECYVHPDSGVAAVAAAGGVCMLNTEASRLANLCRDFLISLRRYTIGHDPKDPMGRVDGGELQLVPRKHELRTTPLDGCTSTPQCQDLADYAAQNASPILPDLQDLAPHKWECLADDARPPIATNNRCVETCGFQMDAKDRDKDCDSGTICVGATSPDAPGICMEGVIPPQSCVNGPQRFEVHASEAFTVIGSRTGYVHPFIEQGGKCTRDPAASLLQIGRLPLKAPACADPVTTDPITGQLSGGGFEPNPCSLTVSQTENEPVNKCDLGNPSSMVVTRDAPAIKFRNRGLTLTLVDPYYPGDKACPGDRQGPFTTDRVPLVFSDPQLPAYQLSFHQTSGYAPLTLNSTSAVNAVFPVKVVAGPTNSIWVLDDGDFLSTTIGLASTRGQVYRVEASSLGTVTVLDRIQ